MVNEIVFMFRIKIDKDFKLLQMRGYLNVIFVQTLFLNQKLLSILLITPNIRIIDLACKAN